MKKVFIQVSILCVFLMASGCFTQKKAVKVYGGPAQPFSELCVLTVAYGFNTIQIDGRDYSGKYFILLPGPHEVKFFYNDGILKTTNFRGEKINFVGRANHNHYLSLHSPHLHTVGSGPTRFVLEEYVLSEDFKDRLARQMK